MDPEIPKTFFFLLVNQHLSATPLGLEIITSRSSTEAIFVVVTLIGAEYKF